MRVRFLSIAVSVCLGTSTLFASLIDEGIDASKVGKLDQSLTKCPAEGCGPTAAVNSFVYLQNMFGSTYDNKLVPPLKPGDKANQNLINVADALLASNYMNVTCGCDTDIRDFIFGIDAYIDSMAPGSTRFRAQMDDVWALPGGRKIPSDLTLNQKTAPTIGFLSNELHDKEDVEILIRFLDKTGHYVTVTHLTWNTATLMGTLQFMDPDGGVLREGMLSETGTSPLQLTYTGADEMKQTGEIFAAMSESPSPEPATIAMAGLGLLFCVIFRNRLIRRRRP